MEDRLKALENVYQETGSIFTNDVKRCKSLYTEFVEGILDASEFLELNVVREKFALPKFCWLEESLQIRNEVGCSNGWAKSKISGEERDQSGVAEGSRETDIDEGQNVNPTPKNLEEQGDGNKEYESLIMSDKGIQTTPLQRARNSMSKRNLLKFLQKSNILKKSDEVYFMQDKSYDADISHGVPELISANSSTANEEPSIYPNSTYDIISPSSTDALASDVSQMTNQTMHKDASSSTDGSLIMETPMFKRVRSKRQSLVSFMLPKNKDAESFDKESMTMKEISVFDESKTSKGSEVSVYQSISLVANGEKSLDFSSDFIASSTFRSMEKSLEISQNTDKQELSLVVDDSDVVVDAAFEDSELESSNAKHVGAVSSALKDLIHQPGILADDKESEETNQQVAIEVFSSEDVERNRSGSKLKDEEEVETEDEVKEDVADDISDQPDNLASLRADSMSVSEPLIDNSQHEEMQTVKTGNEEDDDVISSEEGNYENNDNIYVVKGHSEDKPKEVNLPKAKQKSKKKRKQKKIVMPKNWKPKRKDFIAFFNEAKTKIFVSKKNVNVNVAQTFRKEPRSTGLRKLRETSAYNCVLTEESFVKRDLVPKRRPLLFESDDEGEGIEKRKTKVLEDDGGFAIVERIIWSPKTEEDQNAKEKQDLKEAVDQDDSFVVVNDTKATGTDVSQRSASIGDEILLSIKAKPKRRKGTYTVDIALEVKGQDVNRNRIQVDETSTKQHNGLSIKVMDGKLHENSLEKGKQEASDANDSSVFYANDAGPGPDFGDVKVACEDVLKNSRKKRGRVKTQKYSNDDYEGIRVVRVPDGQDVAPLSISDVKVARLDEELQEEDVANDRKELSEDVNVAVTGEKDSKSGKRVAQTSQKVSKSSGKKGRNAKKTGNARNGKSNMKNRKSAASKGNEEDIQEDLNKVEEEESNDKRANDRRSGGTKLGRKNKKRGPMERLTRSNAKNEDRNTGENHSSVDDGKDCDFGGDSNESVVMKRSSRLRRKPDFYSSINSNITNSSMRDQMLTNHSEVKSGKKTEKKSVKDTGTETDAKSAEISESRLANKSEKKSGGKSAKKGTKKSKKGSEKEPEVKSMTKSDDKMGLNSFKEGEVNEISLNSRKGSAGRKASGRRRNISKDECKNNNREDEIGEEDVRKETDSGEQMKEENGCNATVNVAETTQNDGGAKSNKKRGRKVSIMPTLIIIDETEEILKGNEQPNQQFSKHDSVSNDVIKSTNSPAVNIASNEEETSVSNVDAKNQDVEETVKVNRKRKGRPRKELNLTKKRGRKQVSADVVATENVDCNESTGVRDDVASEAENTVNKDNKGRLIPGKNTSKDEGANCEPKTEVSKDCVPNDGSEAEIVNQTNIEVKGSRRKGAMAEKSCNKTAINGSMNKRMTRGRNASKKFLAEDDKETEKVDLGEVEVTEGAKAKTDSFEKNVSFTKDTSKCVDANKEENVQLTLLGTPDLRSSTRKAKKESAVDESGKENKFAVPKVVKKCSVKKKPMTKRGVVANNDSAVPEKKRRTLFSKKNTSIMALNNSVIQHTTTMNSTRNTTMNTNSVVMPQTLSDFLRSFVAPKVKKTSS